MQGNLGFPSAGFLFPRKRQQTFDSTRERMEMTRELYVTCLQADPKTQTDSIKVSSCSVILATSQHHRTAMMAPLR